MDPLITIHSLYSLALSLKSWLDERKEKESTLVALSSTVSRICTILIPFQTATNLDPTLVDACLNLGDVLSRTKEHLAVWGDERQKFRRVVAFLAPANVTKLLKDDEHDLTQELIMMLFSMAVIGFFRDRSLLPNTELNDALAFSAIKNKEVLEFWHGYIGVKMLWAPYHKFCKALKLGFGDTLSDAACRTLIFRLDEFHMGGVSLSSLVRLVGDGSLRQFIDQLEDSKLRPTTFATNYPLIVWIDDNPSNNIAPITFARRMGVQVIEITSTAVAKTWIEEHEAYLRENDFAQNVRFITDNVRYESDPHQPIGIFRNMAAGENILRYLRGRLYRALVLVYSNGTSETQYVTSYEAAGSTTSTNVVRNYISALAARINTDDGWRGFNRE